MQKTEFYTVSQIADHLGEPPQRVAYVIRKLRIKPTKRFGLTRLFSMKQVAAIKGGLYDIQIRRA